jgi:transcriptional regulator with XRE-family HTH domain
MFRCNVRDHRAHLPVRHHPPGSTEEEERPMIAPASPWCGGAAREGTGKSGDAVAAALRWSPSKVSRYERARTGLRPREVERLLDYYQITGSRRAHLLGLAEDAAQKGWWEEFADSLSDDYQQFIGFEHEATSMAIWHIDVVTGLLQTEGYARHIISSYSRVEPIAPGMIGRLVRVRMRRQQVLNREGLQLSVVLDESVLTRRIGDDAVMYEQLQRLVREADRPNVTLRILPLDAHHISVGESFVIFGFRADSDAMPQDVVSTEQMRSSVILEGSRRRTCTGSRSKHSPRRRWIRRSPGRSSSRRRGHIGRVPGSALAPEPAVGHEPRHARHGLR